MSFSSILPYDIIHRLAARENCFIWCSVIETWRCDAHTVLVSGGTSFDSRSSHCLYWPKVLVIILGPRDRIVNLQVQDNSLLSDTFQFSIYQSSYLRRYCLRPWKCSKINHTIKITQVFISRFFRIAPYTRLSTKSRTPCFFIVTTRPANRDLVVNTVTNNTWRPLTPLFVTYLQHPNISLWLRCLFMQLQ